MIIISSLFCSIRLSGGNAAHEGLVQVKRESDSDWGVICDDFWDANDAHVVCRQLGYRFVF